MHLEQTLGNTKKFIKDYYGNRLNAERLTVISDQHNHINKFVTYQKYCPLRKNFVIYEANNGRELIGNPFAIFLAALEDEQFAHLHHILVVDRKENHPELERFRKHRNVHIVDYESNAYLCALATSQYIITNATLPHYFSKRDGQILLDTWYGTPMKTMGYEMSGGIIASSNIVRVFLSADYLLSANDIMTDMYLKSYKMQGIFPGSIIEEGYPRNDLSLHTNRCEALDLLESMGVSIDPERQILLYAPTWRNAESYNDDIDTMSNVEELVAFKSNLESMIDTSKYQVLVKPHRYLYELIKDDVDMKGKFIPSSMDTNMLLAATDVLVSDFSSIVFDYLVLNRPILFYAPDLEDYRARRGLKYDMDSLPGPCVSTIEDLAVHVNHLEDVKIEYAQKYSDSKKAICPYDDGKVSKRICEILFKGKQGYRKAAVDSSKKKLLFSGGGISYNGLTRSLISLLNQVDYERYDVTVYFRLTGKEMDAFLDEIDSRARVITRVGEIGFTKREDALRGTYDGFGKFNSFVRRTYPRKAFDREARRCFGAVHYDCAIDFNGYEQILSETILSANAAKKVLWLHNDILADMNKLVNGVPQNYWRLNHIISSYPEFDSIASCGKKVMEINRNNFATDETYDKFTYARNTIDTKRILRCLREASQTINGIEYYVLYANHTGGKIELIQLPSRDKITFLNIGRFSPEKNHKALIKAFVKLHHEYPEAELYILGDGPLREAIESQIVSNNAQEYIRVPGNVPNPFIFMSRSDCFILPSLHEGQPLVTLEARACGLPIITGNFSTVEDSLVEKGQLLIDCDEASILEGLCAFMNGRVPLISFDSDAYNRDAFEEFERVIGCD